MSNYKKTIFFFFLFLFLFFANFSLASENSFYQEEQEKKDIIFKARVVEILAEEEKESFDGRIFKQQNLKLKSLEDFFSDRKIIFEGIGSVEILGDKIYKKGDKVFVLAYFDVVENDYLYYVVDHSRKNPVIFIFLFFVIILFLIAGWKGFRSLLALGLSFLIIIFYVIPKILAGLDPVLVTLIGSFFILFFIIYITEGFNIRSHIASFSALIILLFTVFISWFFIYLGKLSGVFSDDVFILLNINESIVNFKGFLLAGIIIGSLGVINDVIVSQVATVEQLLESNPSQSYMEVFKKAYRVGISHVASMTNTLFLAYAGTALSVLILISSPDNPFGSFEEIISNEAISTEIIRALSGSMGIILSVPLSTFLASWFFVWKKNKQKIALD